MNRVATLLLLTALVLSSCTTDVDRERHAFDSGFYWGQQSRLKVETSPQILCAEASDSTLDRRSRCWSVSQLFASYVRPGFSSQQMHAALPDAKWLEDCSLERIIGVGGAVDFDWVSGAAFRLRLFPDNNGWSNWVIDFTLTHEEGYSRGNEDALAFLKGTLTNKQVRLAEFDLFYPIEPSVEGGAISLSERFTPRGVGLQVHP